MAWSFRRRFNARRRVWRTSFSRLRKAQLGVNHRKESQLEVADRGRASRGGRWRGVAECGKCVNGGDSHTRCLIVLRDIEQCSRDGSPIFANAFTADVRRRSSLAWRQCSSGVTAAGSPSAPRSWAAPIRVIRSVSASKARVPERCRVWRPSAESVVLIAVG